MKSSAAALGSPNRLWPGLSKKHLEVMLSEVGNILSRLVSGDFAFKRTLQVNFVHP